MINELVISSRASATRLIRNDPNRFTHLVSISEDASHLVEPYRLFSGDKLFLQMDDIHDLKWAMSYEIVPSVEHVKQLKDWWFTYPWPDQYNVLIHCFAGYSRSPAVGYILCVLDGMEPNEAFEFMRRSCLDEKQPWPNEVLVQWADEHLELGGELIKPMAHYLTELEITRKNSLYG